jgi:hypothetical protein
MWPITTSCGPLYPFCADVAGFSNVGRSFLFVQRLAGLSVESRRHFVRALQLSPHCSPNRPTPARPHQPAADSLSHVATFLAWKRRPEPPMSEAPAPPQRHRRRRRGGGPLGSDHFLVALAVTIRARRAALHSARFPHGHRAVESMFHDCCSACLQVSGGNAAPGHRRAAAGPASAGGR